MASMKKLPVMVSAIALLFSSAALDAAVLPAPVLMAPTNDSAGLGSSATFRWHHSIGHSPLTIYTLVVDKDTFFAPSDFTISPVPGSPNDTQYTISGLTRTARYYWRVSVTDSGVPGIAPSRRTFTTVIDTPLTPVLVSPSDGQVGTSGTTLITPTFVWDSVYGATSYIFQLSTDPAFGSTIATDSILIPTTTKTITAGLLENGKSYFWRVRARNPAGPSPWAKRRFTTYQETYSSWQYHRDFVLNTTASNNGADLRKDALNFPVLVRLNPGNFGWFDSTKALGADIRFTKSDGTTALPYEIERWKDGTLGNDTAEIWVLLDTAKQLNSYHVTAYWGNAAATTRSDPYRVFDANTGFSHVWHMDTTAVRDRTQNGCNGTLQGQVSPLSFIAGQALDFNGGYLSLGSVKTTEFSSGITISAWVRYRSPFSSSNPSLLGFSESNATTKNRVAIGNAGTGGISRWTAGRDSVSGAGGFFQTDTTIHFAATFCHSSTDSLILYKDGKFMAFKGGTAAPLNTPLFQFSSSADSTLAANFIGRNDYTGANFSGYLDEVEVSKTARDSNWIKLAYQTQKFGQTALCYPPSISQPPHDTSVDLPDTARLSVIARGNNLSYQWQRSDNAGGSWSTLSAATAALYKFATSSTDTGAIKPRFRCIVSTPYYSDTSAFSTLTVCVQTVVTSHPTATTQFVGSPASFSVAATPSTNQTYQWQRSNNSGTFNNVPGATANPCLYTPTAADTVFTGIQFRCIVTAGVCGKKDTSDAAALTVCTHITFTPGLPKDTAGVVAGIGSAHFSVAVNAGRFTPSYQWERSNDSGTTWNPISSGNGAATYILAANADGSDNRARFRCRVTNSPCDLLAPSATAILSVCMPAKIIVQPHDTNATVLAPAAFICKATGTSVSYQWQRDTGTGWYSITGATDTLYSFTVTAKDTGAAVQYRCVASSTCGSSQAISNYARVGVCFTALITTSPQPQGVIDGNGVSFCVVATGSNDTCKWWRKLSGGSWLNTGFIGPCYSFTANTALNGSYYRCVVKAACGNAVTSDSALLTVYTPMAFSDTSYPKDFQVTGGLYPSTFSVSVTGSSPSYRWEVSRKGGAFVPITPALGHYQNFNTNTLTVTQADTVDTNAQFHCVVTGMSNTITSRAATLTICFTPVIPPAGQPQNQSNIPPNTMVTFSVIGAQVIGNSSYQWQRSPPVTAWTDITGATGSTYPHSALAGENGYKYRCKVWSVACPGSQLISAVATLTICAPPQINTPPASKGVVEGDNALFNVVATGTGLHYQWQQRLKTAGTGGWNPIGADSSVLLLPFVTIADNDSNFFRCIVNASCGATIDTSTEAFLRVFSRVNVYFDMSDQSSTGPWDTLSLSGTGPFSVWFRDTSSGDIDSCVWNFGDATPIEKHNPRNGGIAVPHIFAVVSGLKTYTVTLTAAGYGGRDTLKRTVIIYPLSSNPIVIKGRYLADTLVELTLTNYKSLRSVAPTPYVISSGIRLWYKSGTALPADTVFPALLLKSYNLGSLKARDTMSYLDTVKVPMSVSDSVYSFMTQLHWDYGYNTPPFDAGNGCSALMRDTLPPSNNLVLASQFLPWDTVIFRLIDTKTALDTSLMDSVGLWWGETTLADFSDIAHTKWWTAAQVINGSVDSTIFGDTTGMFNYTVKNAQFNTGKRKMFTFFVRVLSKKNTKWTDQWFSFMIGRIVPNTPIKFTARAQSATIAQLTWKWDTLICNPDSVRVDSFRIWYAANTAAPSGSGLDTTIYKRVIPEPDISDGWMRISGLQPNTPYAFGAQMYLGSSHNGDFNAGLWSAVTPRTSQWCYWDTILNVDVYDTMYSVDSTITWGLDTSRIPNTIRIDSAVFNPVMNQTRVFWHVDLMGYDSLPLGISYRLRNAVPVDTLIAGLQHKDSTLPVNGISLSAKTITDSFTIDLDQRNITIDNGSLAYDTTYYVMLWLKKSGERWSPPTDSSVATFHVPPFTWQTTRYRFWAVPDSSYWMNGNVRFVVPAGNQNNTLTPRIQAFTPADSTLSGFLKVGKGFSFIDQPGSDPFQIGIRCDSLGGYSPDNVRIYRFDNATRLWRVDRSTVYSTVNSSVYASISTNDLRTPFIAMIDTQPPLITVVSDTHSVRQKLIPVLDTFRVSDNVGNLMWAFYSERGDNLPARQVSGTLANDTATITTSIKLLFVNDQTGARALFSVDDGRYKDTVNVSRRVVHDSGDEITSPEMQWMPFKVQYALADTSASTLWQFVTDAKQQYDKRHVRLFRFYSDASNAASPADQKWIEYAPGTNDALFDLKPGRLFWIKTLKSETFVFGSGTTLPLQNSDTVMLAPNGWTDFALPRGFDLRIGDIIDASMSYIIRIALLDLLKFYQWHDTLNTKNLCEPFYITDIPTIGSSSSLMDYRHGFTVYNPSSYEIPLCIPPISAAMSTYPAGKKAVAGAWALKLIPKTDQGTGLSPVFCGFNKAVAAGGGWYPMPPTWSRQSVGVYDEKTESMYGHRMVRELQNEGASYMLAFRNDTACARSISVKFERIAAFPSGMKTAVYNPSTGETVTLSSASDSLTVGVDGNATSYRWLFVGDATYVATAAKMLSVVKLALERVFPNPARALVRIRYTVPFSLGKVRLSIIDISGRTLWSRTIEDRTLAGGARECLWDGTSSAGKRVASGVFIVRMEAFDQKGKTVGTFSKRLTFLP
jgi:hypothetical protein